MDKFELTTHQPEQPNWFKRLAKAGRVVAYLWTPDGISIAYEGDTIVNHGAYCAPV